ncbi:MAG: RNA 2',3'-cyclic phosphodiesterase [Bacillota bacterium]|nr:RNA 2',3'-cyclic phosphodiesterase [Bacillota bacterium]
MRIFAAVNFTDDFKREIKNTIESLKSQSESGNFTRDENLHLTLVFLGEARDLEKIKASMNEIDCMPFKIKLSGCSSFKRGNSSLYYASLEKNSILNEIQKQLSLSLKSKGFYIEDREFKPHITLGREVVFSGPKLNIKPAEMEVTKLSLMKSERLSGKLTYTEVFYKLLK